MALQKQVLNVNFSQGLDTKTDPFQVTPGKFLSLENTIFDKGGLLQKRNGFGALTSLPNNNSTYLTTYNGNLTALGTTLQSYSAGTETWTQKGHILPVKLSTESIFRSGTNQSQMDSAIAPNGLICTVFTDNPPSGVAYKYVIADSITGENIVPPTLIPVVSGTVTGSPRVFALGRYFIIVFTNVISATAHLQYVAVNTAIPTSVTTNSDISVQYGNASSVSFDGVVVSNQLYIAWNGSDLGGAVRMTSLSATLNQSNTVIFPGYSCNIIGLSPDLSGSSPIIYVAFYKQSSTSGYVLAVDNAMATILAPTQIISSGTVENLTPCADNGACDIFYEVLSHPAYDTALPGNFINKVTVTQAGSVSSTTTLLRGVGLASKAFEVADICYFLTIYNSVFQPTYFLSDEDGNIVAKLAYSNAVSAYYTTGLPNVTVNDNVAQVPYLYKDLISAVNKTQGAPNAAGVYSQTGINLANFTLGVSKITTGEIGHDLHISGGFMWMYDGFLPVEHNFHLWPDSVEATGQSTGGSMTSQIYFYVATYEWSDNQGNVFRSAPSIPVEVDLSGAGSSTCSVTIDVPTLRLTYKIVNPVRIVLYRWSEGQQIYYQTTSLTVPTLNDTTIDYVVITDTNSDDTIAGNNILYTTGGVVEDIAAPATDLITLFQSRLFLVDAEDNNLLWFSKQVIEGTPVEMSDLFTLYIAPTIGAQGSTGGIEAMASLDDKLILFKQDAAYYIAGTGPDNTGANSQFSEPVFITATVGCANQQSIVFMPAGLLFQSDKGIWLLGRDLSTNYIGAPVESFTQDAVVLSAINVPGTNQVRFTLDSGITLMYDYYYGQWGTFVNVPAISSTLYQGMHTYINSLSQVRQETPAKYLDGSSPVLMSFTTSWFNLAGLQGFERAYYFYLLGTYVSPHKLQVQIAYDYQLSPSQTSFITPDNYSQAWGLDPLWGSTPFWGGQSTVEQWRVFLRQQKCQAFQISINEVYDSTFGQASGAGLTISGLDLVTGMKKGYPTLRPSRSVG